MRLAILTGMYVGVVCSAQIGAQKIVELPWTGEPAPGRAVLIGAGFAASALLAGWNFDRPVPVPAT